MTEAKTKENDANVEDFLRGISDEQQRADSKALQSLMEDVTDAPAKMWGSSIIGFDTYHYTYKSGREGDWMVTGFSPRKSNITIYVMDGFDEYRSLLAKLGKHTVSKGCLYIKKLDDIDQSVLGELLSQSVKRVKSGDFLL